MDIFVTSHNTGPSWGADPKNLVYFGTSESDAIQAVGAFKKYEEDIPTRFPDIYSALPNTVERELVHYYMADGWWYSVEKVVL